VALPDSVEDRGRGQKRDGKRKEGGEDMSGITKGGVSSEEHVAEMGDGHSEAGSGGRPGRPQRGLKKKLQGQRMDTEERRKRRRRRRKVTIKERRKTRS